MTDTLAPLRRVIELLNTELAYTQFPFRMIDQFRMLEREAREAGRGLWATR